MCIFCAVVRTISSLNCVVGHSHISQALASKSGDSGDQDMTRKFNDFTWNDLVAAVRVIKATAAAASDETSDQTSQAIVAMEGLLTTAVSDESAWCMAWVKMIRYVLRRKCLPKSLAELDLDVPTKFQYMTHTSLAGNGDNTVKDEPGQAAQANAPAGEGAPSQKDKAKAIDRQPKKCSDGPLGHCLDMLTCVMRRAI